MPDTPMNPAEEWCAAVLRAVAAVEDGAAQLRRLANSRPPGAPAERLRALLELWDLLGMDASAGDPVNDRAHRLKVRQGAVRDILYPAEDLFRRVDEEIVAAGPGADVPDPVIDIVGEYGPRATVFRFVRLDGWEQSCSVVLWRDIPEGHPLRDALPESDCFALELPDRHRAVILSPRWRESTRGKVPWGWCRVSSTKRLTAHWRQDQLERLERKKAEKEWAEEQRKKEYEERPDVKERRMREKLAALEAEVQRLKGAGPDKAAGQDRGTA